MGTLHLPSPPPIPAPAVLQYGVWPDRHQLVSGQGTFNLNPRHRWEQRRRQDGGGSPRAGQAGAPRAAQAAAGRHAHERHESCLLGLRETPCGDDGSTPAAAATQPLRAFVGLLWMRSPS